MEEIAWKCSAAFLLGAATHYLIAHHLQSDSSSSSSPAPSTQPAEAADAKPKDGETPAQDGENNGEEEEFESDDSEWEDMDENEWQPHKMVLCVRTDLKMGKGEYCPAWSCCCCYGVCCHATLGAYKRAVKRAPKAVKAWEMLGQAKVCLKVDSEEELLSLAAKASAHGLINYVVVDAGRTQIAPDSKTVLGIGPAPIEAINDVTGHLKLM